MVLLMDQSRSVLPLRSAKAREFGELWREKCTCAPWNLPFKLARTGSFGPAWTGKWKATFNSWKIELWSTHKSSYTEPFIYQLKSCLQHIWINIKQKMSCHLDAKIESDMGLRALCSQWQRILCCNHATRNISQQTSWNDPRWNTKLTGSICRDQRFYYQDLRLSKHSWPVISR